MTGSGMARRCHKADFGLLLPSRGRPLPEPRCVRQDAFAGRIRWDDAELVELLAVAGFYRLVLGILNSAGVQFDAGVPGFPTA